MFERSQLITVANEILINHPQFRAWVFKPSTKTAVFFKPTLPQKQTNQDNQTNNWAVKKTNNTFFHYVFPSVIHPGVAKVLFHQWTGVTLLMGALVKSEMDQRVGRYSIHQARNHRHQHTYHMPIPLLGSKFHPQTWPLGRATTATIFPIMIYPKVRSWHTETEVWYQSFIPKTLQQKKPHDDKHPATPPSKESESGVATANPLGYLQKNLASVVVASEANPRLLARLNRKRTSWCCRLQDPQDHPREIWRKQKHGEIEISQWKNRGYQIKGDTN